MKELRWVTRGIFYCRVSGGFNVSASNKVSCNLTGQCFEIGNKNIPPTVCVLNQCVKAERMLYKRWKPFRDDKTKAEAERTEQGNHCH